MLDRFERRFGSRPDTTMTALLYDQGRAAVEAIVNAPAADGPGLAAGLERIKMMPSTLGGPRTYIGDGPEDHRGYRGDFRVQMREVSEESGVAVATVYRYFKSKELMFAHVLVRQQVCRSRLAG
jgi:branched-chain amino acid transport system substrate-binding protein